MVKIKQTYHVECDDEKIYDYEAIGFENAFELARKDGHNPVSYEKEYGDIPWLLDLSSMYYSDLDDVLDDFKKKLDLTVNLVKDEYGNLYDECYNNIVDNYWTYYCSDYSLWDKYRTDEVECSDIKQEHDIDCIIYASYMLAYLQANKDKVKALFDLINNAEESEYDNNNSDYNIDDILDMDKVDENIKGYTLEMIYYYYKLFIALRKKVESFYNKFNKNITWDLILKDYKEDNLLLYFDEDNQEITLTYKETDNFVNVYEVKNFKKCFD